MLEVVFSDSIKGSMKVAKNYNTSSMLSGAAAIGYIGGKKPRSGKAIKAELNKRFEGKAVGGSSEEVACIGFALDIGDISGEIDGSCRQDVFRQVWSCFDFNDEEQEQFFQNQRKDMDKLLTAANEGTPIRIWKSSYPYSTCGFYYVCNLLRDINCDLRVISLPEYIRVSDDEIVTYNGWNDVMPGNLYKFLPLERHLSQSEKMLFSKKWHNLMLENAPLRASINDKLVSVPEDFYDFIIIKNIPNDDFLMARLIGEIMSKYALGISDSWYALRIEKMIDDKKLIVVDSDESHPYGKTLRKVI